MSSELLKRAKEVCNNYVQNYKKKELSTNPAKGKQRIKILSVSDFHFPFARMDLVENIIKEHSGAEYCVVNGDLFDSYIISKFSKNKEVPFAVEYAAAFALVVELSKNFGEVILVDGNHEKGRFATELQKLNQSIRFLVKSSPLEYIAEGVEFSEAGVYLGTRTLTNVHWAGEGGKPSWFHHIGGALFAHRLNGYKSGPLANTVDMANHFMKQGTEFQALITGHCFDQETEILTAAGWKTIDTIQKTDEAYTLNLETNKLETNPIEAIWKYDNFDKLIRFSNSDGLDIRVTDQHGMLARINGELRKLEAKELAREKKIEIPCLGNDSYQTASKAEEIPYKGKVWCLTVPNGTLVARRSGCVFITQNSHHVAQSPYMGKLLVDQGCLCMEMEYIDNGSCRYYPSDLGYAVVYLDKSGNVDFETTKYIHLGSYTGGH